MSRVSVIGAGYIGLTSEACLADLRHDVRYADILPEKVAALSRGEIPILERWARRTGEKGLTSGCLSFVLGASASEENSFSS